MNIGIYSYSYAIATTICAKPPQLESEYTKPRWKWKKRICERIRSCIRHVISFFSTRSDIVPYFMSPETANNSTQSIHNILTEREIEQIMESCSNYNLDYLPSSLIIRHHPTNKMESTVSWLRPFFYNICLLSLHLHHIRAWFPVSKYSDYNSEI